MSKLSYTNQRRVIITLFLLVPLLLLGTFSYYPALNLAYISFTSWDGISRTKELIGFDNYRQLLNDPSIFGVFLHNLAYLLVGFVQIIIALYFAVALNSKLRARNIYKTVLFAPYIINSVAVAFMFNYLLNNEYGALNLFLKNSGLESLALNWLGEPKLVNFSMAFMSLWKYMGFMMVIFLGGLQSIPGDVYEAASIDGAAPFQTFWYITLPGIRKIIELSLFLNLNGVLGMFEFPFAIYPLGSPLGISDTFVTKTVNTAFRFSNFGLASSMGIVLMVITASLVFLQKKIVFRKED